MISSKVSTSLLQQSKTTLRWLTSKKWLWTVSTSPDDSPLNPTAHPISKIIGNQSKRCSRTSPWLSICHVGGWVSGGVNVEGISHFLCVPLAAAVEVAGTVPMNTAGSTWESSLKLESSQRVLLSVPQRLWQSQLPMEKCTSSSRNSHNYQIFIVIIIYFLKRWNWVLIMHYFAATLSRRFLPMVAVLFLENREC